jgi:nitrite reductase/ring-hydroxylating ferredoxin subunit
MTSVDRPMLKQNWQRAATLTDLEPSGMATVRVGNYTIVLCRHAGRVYALDNRCPHMGFPLDRGTCSDGILTCHWHAARFDIHTGGTFDQFADDGLAFPVEVRGDEIWVDPTPQRDQREYYRRRLRDGLEQDLRLVLAKGAIALLDGGGDPGEPLRIGLEFGTLNRRNGWGQGLTILTCMANLLPYLNADDRPRAIYHGLDAVSRDTVGSAPRFPLAPLPGAPPDAPTLKRWLRRFLAVRDDEGAERVVISAVRAGLPAGALADMLFSAATDYRYIQVGHPLDFVNKACEALDAVGWDGALPELALSSLVRGIAAGSRQEESNAWRHPIDLVAIVEAAFPAIPAAVEAGSARHGAWRGRQELAGIVLGDDPRATAEALLAALRAGATAEELAGAVSYAAALRIARFHTSNEFGDWDTALHTFTFANAVQMGLRRLAAAGVGPAPDLLRGVFDAAMSVYLDRFLNVPPARIPTSQAGERSPDALLAELTELFDRQQQVGQAAELVAAYLGVNGEVARLLAALGRGLLREDRDFHTIQAVDAAFAQYRLLEGTPEAGPVLIAAARYLAAHAPTARAQEQTYRIALRLHRNEQLFEG